MAENTSERRRNPLFVTCALLFSSLALPAHAVGVGGFSGGGAGSGGVAGAGGSLSGSSVISHGSAGFSIYNGQGVTRVIGGPPQRSSVQLPDGRSARIVGDGRGGAYLLGAPGNHWIPGPNTNALPNPARQSGDGP